MKNNPYTLQLGRQIVEIPFQMVHHLLVARPVAPSLKIRFGSAWRQYMLCWVPPGPDVAGRSIIILYHGGGWRLGWPGLFPTLAEFFLRQGFPVVMPAYRLAPFASYRHMREDLSLALVKTLEWSRSMGWGDRKLLAGGVSAGATLAAHLVFDRQALANAGLDQRVFSGYFSIAGPLDLDRMPDFRAIRSYAGGKPGSPAFRDANPVHYLQAQEFLPVLMMHSPEDAIVPYESALAFYQKYTGPKSEIVLKGKTHLGSMRFATDDLETAAVFKTWLEGK